MTQVEIQYLKAINQINRDFYTITNQFLNHTDNYFWAGWNELSGIVKPHLDPVNLKVLDIGCGDGRFSLFLKESGFNLTSYLGLDNSDFSLNITKNRISSIPKSLAVKIDFIEKPNYLESLNFKPDLIVLFGVLHHIPTFAFRLQILKEAVKCLGDGSILIFTTFQYLDIPRLKRQVLDLTNEKYKQFFVQKYNLDLNLLEPGDNILEWKKALPSKELTKAYRFSHYFNAEEVRDLIHLSGLELIESFTEKAFEGGLNKYFVCKIKSK